MMESEYFSDKNKDFYSFFNKNNKVTSPIDIIVYIISLDSINNNNDYLPYFINLYLNEIYVFLYNYDNIKKHISSMLKENENININDTFLEKLFNNILFITYLKFKTFRMIKKQIEEKNLDKYIEIINMLNDKQIDLEKLHSNNKTPIIKENKLPIGTIMNSHCEFIRKIFLNKNLNEIKKDMDNLKEFKFSDYKEYTQLINKYDKIDLKITIDNIKKEMLEYTFDETDIDFNKMNENFNNYNNKIFDLSKIDCNMFFLTGFIYIYFTISNTHILNKDNLNKIKSIHNKLKTITSVKDIEEYIEEVYENLLSSINHIMKEENITLKENFKNTKTDVFIEFLQNLKLKLNTLKNKTDKIKNLNNKIDIVLKNNSSMKNNSGSSMVNKNTKEEAEEAEETEEEEKAKAEEAKAAEAIELNVEETKEESNAEAKTKLVKLIALREKNLKLARNLENIELEASTGAELNSLAADELEIHNNSSSDVGDSEMEIRITELEKELKAYENKIKNINLENEKRRELKEKSINLELLQKQKELEVKHTNLNPMSSEEKDRLFLSQSYNNYSLFPHSINHKSIYELENEFKLSNFDFDDESILTNRVNYNFKGMVNELCQKYSKI